MRRADPTLTMRRADPTLTTFSQTAEGWLVVLMDFDGWCVAHRPGGCGVGPDNAGRLLATSYARWFSVPCRECFPDAPPPGMRPCLHENKTSCGGGIVDGLLAWQVNPW